jgi:uncharacterized protein involved in outer membrane biogenesis
MANAGTRQGVQAMSRVTDAMSDGSARMLREASAAGTALRRTGQELTADARVFGRAYWQSAHVLGVVPQDPLLAGVRAVQSRRALDSAADEVTGLGNVLGTTSNAPNRLIAPENLAGSTAHRAARWEAYQARGGTWGRARWDAAYDLNMSRATDANKVVDAYHAKLGWGKREVTIDVEGIPRRLDIADAASMRGREIKSGYQTATQENLWEVQRDQILRDGGWDLQWHFEGRASKPLLRALDSAGIPYSFGKK